MNKANLQKTEYESLIVDYINFRNQTGSYFLKMAEIIAQAKNRLKSKNFKKFLRDPRINLKRLQANKLITIYEVAKSDSRLTHIFNKEGVEKSYLITTIKDSETRNQFIEIIKNDDLSVKQTKRAILFVQRDNKTALEAIQKAKEANIMPARSVKQEKEVIPIAEYNSLKSEYEKLLKEKQELELKLQKNPLSCPEETKQKIKIVEGQKPLDLAYLN